LVVDKSGTEVHVYRNGTEIGSSPFNLSSETKYYLAFEGQGTSSNPSYESWSQVNIDYVREVTGAGNSKIFQTNATTSGSTITNAILVANTVANGGTIQWALSADNGANFENVTPNQIHRFTNTGTQLIVKGTFTESSTINEVTSHNWTPEISEFGVIYNWY